MDFENVTSALERRGFAVRRFDTKEQTAAALQEALQEAKTVGIGGSCTVRELDVVQSLKEAGKTVFWHWLPAQEGVDARREALGADVYLASANAVTADGKLLFIDGTGNRVAAVCYGPKRVILVIGRNKLAEDTEAGFRRIHETACPQNARRLGNKTPCAVTGICADCRSPQRMCRAVLTLEGCPGSHPVEVWLVNEALGF